MSKLQTKFSEIQTKINAAPKPTQVAQVKQVQAEVKATAAPSPTAKPSPKLIPKAALRPSELEELINTVKSQNEMINKLMAKNKDLEQSEQLSAKPRAHRRLSVPEEESMRGKRQSAWEEYVYNESTQLL